MGGEAKARGTREERVAKAIALKNEEDQKRITIETVYCYHQRYFLDNVDEFKDIIHHHRLKLENFVFNSLTKSTKARIKIGDIIKLNIPDSLLTDYFGVFFSITLKKMTKIHYKAIFETAYGFCSFTFAPNGTAGFYISENIECEILDTCFKTITQMDYITDKITEEMNETIS